MTNLHESTCAVNLIENHHNFQLGQVMSKKVYNKMQERIKSGQVFPCTGFGKFKLLRYMNTDEVTIQIIATGYVTTVRACHIRSGKVLDRLKPSVRGIGYVGTGKYRNRVKGKDSKSYQLWVSMFKRCYGKGYPSYRNTTVCKEWHNFQVFCEWLEVQVKLGRYAKGMDLDKDLLQIGVVNKVYSPSTCVFLTHKDNGLLTGSFTNKQHEELLDKYT